MREPSKPSVPRAVKSQQVKDSIYQAAIDLLHEYGYQYITVSNICKMANVSTGSFYHFFESKDALMTNFFVNAYNDFVATHKQICEDPIENIIQGLCYYADFCQELGLNFVRNFHTPFNQVLDIRPNGSGTGAPTLPSIADATEKIHSAIQKGVLRDDVDASQLANDLAILAKGCIFEWCVSGGTFDLQELTRRLTKTHLKAYQK